MNAMCLGTWEYYSSSAGKTFLCVKGSANSIYNGSVAVSMSVIFLKLVVLCLSLFI